MPATDKTTLAAAIASDLADASGITAADLRGVLTDLLDSTTQTAAVAGAGTDYTLTGSAAAVVFGTTSPELALPGAGTFLILATMQITADAAGAGDEVRFKLRNTTDAADVGAVRRVTLPANSALVPVDLTETVTVAAAKTIQLWAWNETAAQGTVLAAGTGIRWVRLG